MFREVRRLVIVLYLLRLAPPKTLDEARSQIDGLWGIVIELKTQNDEPREEVRELGERIGKSSRNSSRAPSSDSTSQRAKRAKKPKSHKRQGNLTTTVAKRYCVHVMIEGQK